MDATALTLAIEISNPPAIAGGGEVALARIGADRVEMVRSAAVASSGRHDDALLPAIDRLCREAGVAPTELDRIAVSAGPGGYTSVRIAVTSAKMIAMATGAELRPVPTALCAWLGVDPGTRSSRPVRVLLAWKREDVWAADFAAGAAPADPAVRGALIKLSEQAGDDSRVIVAERALIERLRGLGAGGTMIESRLSAELVARASGLVKPADPLTAAPIYPREPEAVSKWRELGKGAG